MTAAKWPTENYRRETKSSRPDRTRANNNRSDRRIWSKHGAAGLALVESVSPSRRRIDRRDHLVATLYNRRCNSKAGTTRPTNTKRCTPKAGSSPPTYRIADPKLSRAKSRRRCRPVHAATPRNASPKTMKDSTNTLASNTSSATAATATGCSLVDKPYRGIPPYSCTKPAPRNPPSTTYPTENDPMVSSAAPGENKWTLLRWAPRNLCNRCIPCNRIASHVSVEAKSSC